MEKMILIIDDPVYCKYCPMCKERRNFGWYCSKWYPTKYDMRCNIIEDIDSQTRPDWCPLKAIPSKREEKYASEVGDRDSGFIDGWNACIDEILADNEGWLKMVEANNN